MQAETLADGCGVYMMATILFSDDPRNIRKFWQREMERGGYRVLLASNGMQAKVAFKNETPDWVILYIRMADNGVVSIDWIILHHPLLPIIVYTADSSFRENHPNLPIRACITKSGDPMILLKTIADVLGISSCRSIGTSMVAWGIECNEPYDHKMLFRKTNLWEKSKFYPFILNFL